MIVCFAGLKAYPDMKPKKNGYLEYTCIYFSGIPIFLLIQLLHKGQLKCEMPILADP